MEYFLKAQVFFQQSKELWAVMLGMFIQYWFGEQKCYRVVMTIVLATLVVALFFVPMVIEVLDMILSKLFQLHVTEDGKIAIALYAFSTIISVDILAMAINLLPKAMKAQAKKYLGIPDENSRPKD